MLVKIIPLNVKDKTPRFSTLWQFMRVFYKTYSIQHIEAETGVDYVIYSYQGTPVIRLEPVEDMPQEVSYAA